MDKNDKRGVLRSGLLIAAFAVTLYTVLQDISVLGKASGWIWGIVSPVVLGMCIAFVMNVALIYVEKGLGLISKGRLKGAARRAVGILLTILIMFGVVVLAIAVIFPAIGDTISQLVSYLPKSSEGVTEWLSEILAAIRIPEDTITSLIAQINNVVDQLLDFLKREYVEIATVAIDATTSVMDVVMDFVVSLIFAIYILAAKEELGAFIRDIIRRFMKPRRAEGVMKIASMSYGAFTNFVKGQLLEAVILGVLCFIGMLIFGFPYAGVVSMLIGVTALIPIFGAFIGAGISALLILIVSPIEALLFIVFILILQQLEGNLIYPRVVGQSMGLPGIIVLAAVTLGGNIAGITGMLLGVPVCAVLYALLREAVYGAEALEKNN